MGVAYFSHDSDMRNSIKLKAVRSKYGVLGYGWFNILLEIFLSAQSDDYALRYSDVTFDALAVEFESVSETTQEFIDYCIRARLLVHEDDWFWSQGFRDRQDIVKMRTQSKIDAGKRSWEVKRAKEQGIDPDTFKQNETKAMSQLKELFAHWNAKGIIVHQKMTDKMMAKMKSAIKNHSIDGNLDVLKKAIDNYAEVLAHPDKYFFSYKWSIDDFMSRGVEKFKYDTCFTNMLRDKGKAGSQVKPLRQHGDLDDIPE